MRTWAVVFPEANDLGLAEVQLPALEPDDVLIRTECSFVSTGTERCTWQGKMGWRGGEFAFPIVPAYRKVGRAEDVGADVTRFAQGQHVFMTTSQFTAMALRSQGTHVWLAGQHDARLALALGRSAAGSSTRVTTTCWSPCWLPTRAAWMSWSRRSADPRIRPNTYACSIGGASS
jgi:2-desacetyl-2-hydroxyethyl bacteriochlorophyllide A dehydrogenase